jgi:hypothetical protein
MDCFDGKDTNAIQQGAQEGWNKSAIEDINITTNFVIYTH